ncbi:ribonuclease toxin immunity protein CdiI [Orbus sturtevantii]|uniref:ribonuclease toxin immunity protein CdiI n=1 Tax=Orbus sturtevantii TaxID=3074109 RepID=UPI00370DCA82
MIKELFSKSDVDLGLNLVIVSYFDRIYEDDNFLKVVGYMVQSIGFSTDGAYCHFACEYDGFLDDMVFEEGVFFAIGYPPAQEDTVIVSEMTCYQYVYLACEKYLTLHPEDTDKVNQLLAKIAV